MRFVSFRSGWFVSDVFAHGKVLFASAEEWFRPQRVSTCPAKDASMKFHMSYEKTSWLLIVLKEPHYQQYIVHIQCVIFEKACTHVNHYSSNPPLYEYEMGETGERFFVVAHMDVSKNI